MANPTVQAKLNHKNSCWPYGLPTLRIYDGKDHPVTVIEKNGRIRIEPDPFTLEMEVEMSRHTGK